MPYTAPNERRPTRIVGIGASAGGLAPLEAFVSHVPADSGMAFVVVQHMDPTHKGMLRELLQRTTTMQVYEARDRMHVEPNAVYVIPPNTELSVSGGLLHLADPAQPRGMRLPIDVLFLSLARDQGERAIGVVLSGMGADGTIGLQAIKSQGGLTLAQQPESAQFDAMPKAAQAAGCVDIVALPSEMPQRIVRVVSPGKPVRPPAAADDGDGLTVLPAILDLLRSRSKHDLSPYKTSTLTRRIERRMAVHGLRTQADYALLLEENPQEIDLLFKEMLIGVTSFFRDPAVWQGLKDVVLPGLLARHTDAEEPLRAWVVGCSTGEEAYSLAMVFREVTETSPRNRGCALKIFATDLNADAIAFARQGRYTAAVARALSPERLARFFQQQGERYLVDKSIREMVLFAQHDVILDPPFIRLDLLMCRNLLIYFNTELQRRLMPQFHYCLRPGAVLVLGGSETIGQSHTLFTPLDVKSKFYRRNENAAGAGAVDFPTRRRVTVPTTTLEPTVPRASPPPANLPSLADHLLLQQFAPPAVLVNAGGDILYVSGRTGRYLEPAAGKANWNIHVMARPGIRIQLAAALREAMKEGKPVRIHGLALEDDDKHTLEVTIYPVDQPAALSGTVMIVFHEIAVAPIAGMQHRPDTGGGDPALGEQLARSQEEARMLRQEMQASQEELQAANEELQSTNEELQSANEELTTSKEEAQSMNEELQTINLELQSKLDDLALAQSDMQNLLNSTDIATLFLDNDLNVRRFTEQVTRIINLREGDIGRPLSDLATTMIYPELHDDVRATLRTLVFCEKEIKTTEDRWYSVRIMPYRTLSNVIQGAVITFVDITTAKELESRLRKE